jgi:N-methylhydantoinase A
VTVERGVDPRELALVAFGGAGPLHAVQIAEELGMTQVIAPVSSGVLSALGLVVSERRRDVVESVLLSGDALTREEVAAVVERLGARGREDLAAPNAGLRATYELRYAGQAFELPVEGELVPDPAELRRAFDAAHSDRYGYEDPDAELELVTVRVAAALPGGEILPADAEVRRRDHPEVTIFELPGSTLVVPPGWATEVRDDAVVLEREA